jgi:hypothetical protein
MRKFFLLGLPMFTARPQMRPLVGRHTALRKRERRRARDGECAHAHAHARTSPIPESQRTFEGAPFRGDLTSRKDGEGRGSPQ